MTALVLARDEKDLRRYSTAINELGKGRSNAAGSVTLTANAASTTVTAKNCGVGSVVLLSPRSAHAAAEIAAGTLFVSTVANGSFTLTHASNAQNDRIFGYVCLG
jgi:hypothetical protein